MAKTAAKISLHNKSDTDGGIALKPRGGGTKQALTAAASHAPAPMDLDTPAPKVGFLDGLKSVAVGLVGGGSSNGHVLIEKKSSLQPINQDDIDTEPDTREEEEEDDSTVEEARGQQKPAASPAKKKAVAPSEPAVVAMDTSSPVAEEEKPQAAKEEKKKKPKKASTKGKSKSKKKEATATASDEPEKAAAAAGRDKPKGGKGLGKDNKQPAPKRHGKKPKRPNIDSVLCGKALRGLARRGNVRRMSIGSVDDMKIRLKSFLELITRDVVQITSHAKRVTVTPEDVAYALQRNGVPLWGGGIKDAKRKPKEGGGDAVAAKKEAHAAAAASEPTTATASADKAVHA